MSPPKRLVLFVEGKGDVTAIPTLAKRVINELGAHDALFVDPMPFRVRGVATLVKNRSANWHDWLNLAGATRPSLGAVLLVLDGDADHVPEDWATHTKLFNRHDFCAFRTAAALGQDAQTVRAGQVFSLASVFAMKEFETWLLAGIESLRGIKLTGDRGIVSKNAECPTIDLEKNRDAKKRLRSVISVYSPTLDQGMLAAKVDLQMVRGRCRSFRRFCSAIDQLVGAVRHDTHVITPGLPAR